MWPKDGQPANWKEAGDYAPLLAADRATFAWEWLRRNSAYRIAAEAAAGPGVFAAKGKERLRGPGHWSLVAFERPDSAAPVARPMWRADAHPAVLAAVAGEAEAGEDAFELARFAELATVLTGPGQREHLLLSDGLRSVRIDLIEGTFERCPVQLRYLLSGFAAAERPLLTLRRLMALARTGRFSRSLHPQEVRARRWVLMLRAYDAFAAGADQREIAAVLLSRDAREPRWRSSSPSLRSQAQRLVRAAQTMARGGYVELLR